jgi:hypothetical protein
MRTTALTSLHRPDLVDPDEALRRLVAEGVITEAQAAAVHDAQAQTRTIQGGRWWAEVAGYVGGVLVLGAGALLLATSWDLLSEFTRGVLLSAGTLVLASAGVALAGGPSKVRALGRGDAPARRRIVGVLFALAAGVAAGAGGVFAETHAAVSAFAVGLLVAAAGYVLLPTVPGVLATASMSMLLDTAVVGDLANADSLFTLGVTYVALGAVWVLIATVIPQRQVGLAGGAALAVVGAQLLFDDPGGPAWAYGLTFAIAALSFFLYRMWRDTVLLVAGVVAASIAAPEAVWHWTDGAASGALVLLVAGLALIGASGLGLRLRRGAS